uniref:Protein-serine O-palmitoleoyltransferase porcupine n=2 Tax=Lygus hesperus TaxID=30085 RepID=A0A0A9XHP3_LYGHE
MYDDLAPEPDSYDLLEDDDSYFYQDAGGDDDDLSTFTTSISTVYRYCLKPTVLDAYSNLLHIFLVCLVFRTLTQLVKIPHPFHHLTSAFSGVYVLYVVFGYNAVYTVLLAAFGCVSLKTSQLLSSRHRDYITSAIFLFYLLISEFGLINQPTWERIRGPQMVMCMKIISYCFDLRHSSSRAFNAYDFLGYVLCPGTLVFGPWVPFADYMAAFENDKWDLKWLSKVFSHFLKSLFFFALSVCLLEWIIPDEASPNWLMYRDAMLFRVGHYFVSFVSETSAHCAGLTKTEVTRPMSIEFPDSLVQVVVYWNLPIHRWLKTYVFRTTLPAGTFVAVMSTYFVSALLHGANAKLSAILLSLGIYTYVEYCLRKKLSDMFGACIAARPCTQPCSTHKHRTTSNIVVHTINLAFSLLAMFHLAYLGSIIDTTGGSSLEPFSRWARVSYVSHVMVVATYLVHCSLSLIW